MVFNGHTEQYIESLDEELFTEIQVMYADGLLGNRGVFDALTPLTTLVYNYLRAQNAPALQGQNVFPWIHEYSVEPQTERTKEEQINDGLLLFLSQSPDFKMERFRNARQ